MVLGTPEYMLGLALVEALIPERAMPLGWFPMVCSGQDSLGEQLCLRVKLILSFNPGGSTIVGSLRGPQLGTTL